MFRQGDVLIIPVKSIPKSAKPIDREGGRAILAHGEATGHSHAIGNPRAMLYRDDAIGRTFLTVSGADVVELTHEEHATIGLAPGNYEVRIQRTYTPEAVRNVAD